jgi:hypothetical protein
VALKIKNEIGLLTSSQYLRLLGAVPSIDWNASEKRQRQRLALTNPAILLGPAREAIAIERARFRFNHL